MRPVLVLKRRSGGLHHFAVGRELGELGWGEPGWGEPGWGGLGRESSRMFWELPIGFL